jgi:tetratricopeptide (TPR) repeat protein
MNLTPSLVVELKELLPESSWSWVIGALRQDTLIWENLQDQGKRKRAIEIIGDKPEAWSPAVLALIDLDYPDPLDLEEFEDELLQRAVKTSQALLKATPSGIPKDLTLADAGLLAISLVERRQRIGSWNGLTGDIFESHLTNWYTPMACLFGLVKDRSDLLRTLIYPNAPETTHKLAIHALISNPIPPSKGVDILKQALDDLRLPDLVAFLRLLHSRQPGIATTLALSVIDEEPSISNHPITGDYSEQIDQILNLISQSDLNYIGGQLSQAASLQTMAYQASQKLQTEIAAQISEAIARNGNIDSALSSWKHLRPHTNGYGSTTESFPPPGLILALLDADQPADALALFPSIDEDQDEVNDVAYLIALVRLAVSQGNFDKACKNARRALDILVVQGKPFAFSSKGSKQLSTSVAVGLSRHLMRLFIDLGLPKEAIRVASVAVALKSNDPELYATLANLYRISRDLPSAIEAAQTAVALSPQRTDLRFILVDYLEMNGNWSEALKERTQLLEKRFSTSSDLPWPTYDHHYALATCALHAGEPQRAADICQQILRENPADGLAHAAFGEALEALGDPQAAFDHFHQATQITPYHATPWLSLAHAHQRNGHLDKAIDTLRSATHAVTNDPLVHLELAEIYLEQNSPTQALNSLRQAYQVSNDHNISPSIKMHTRGYPDEQSLLAQKDQATLIALRLGTTLYDLGHMSEARKILAEAYQANPAYPGLAHIYAKSLLALKEPVAAIAPLVVALQAQPTDPQPHLDYTFALLETGEHPEEALKSARQVLELSPQNTLGQAYLAEALAANGELLPALQSYFQVFDSDLVNDPIWHSRLAKGMGNTALALEKPEVAIATLQESARLDPKNPDIQRLMAEAYIRLQLPREAMEAAQNAIQLAPDDVDTLSWFAKHALLLDSRPQALKALTRAIQLNPKDASLLVQLASLQSQVGETTAARKTFHQVLSSERANIQDLSQSAHGLLDLEDASGAVACLERANNILAEPDVNLLHDLAIAYMQTGENDNALETINQAITLDPQDSDLHISKADLLIHLDRPQAAQAALEHALQDDNCDISLHHRLALILRSNGDLIEALSHAEQMVSLCNQSGKKSDTFLAHTFAGEMARALLQHEKARRFLDIPIDSDQDSTAFVEADGDRELNGNSALLYYALTAELALEEGEEIGAAEALTKAIGIDPDHPRLIALQARLTQPRGNNLTAIKILNLGLKNFKARARSFDINQIDEDEETHINLSKDDASTASLINLYDELQDLYALATTALDLLQWNLAIDLLRMVTNLTPSEPYGHLLLARTLVLRAEYQRLCETAGAIKYAPGPASLTQQSYLWFDECIRNATDCNPGLNPKDGGSLPLTIQRWKARGDAVFQPTPENLHTLDALSSQPDDVAARIATDRQLGDLAGAPLIDDAGIYRSNPYSYNAKVLIQQALSLDHKGRRQEDILEAKNKSKSAVEKEPNQPLYHVIYADIAHRSGDYPDALKALQTALSFWPDEPRWHSRIAQLCLDCGDPTAAITHLERAAELEPDNVSHHIILGKALIQTGDLDGALQVLEGAERLAPRHFEVYMAFAKLYIAMGDYAKAASFAENAISMEPTEMDPILLRCEIALKAADPRGAYQRAQTALKINPNDPQALRYLARALDGLERYNEALSMVDQAIKNSSDPLPLLVERVDLIEKSQGSQAAFTALQQLSKDYPDEPIILAPLANAYAAAGQRESAIHAAQQALHGKSGVLDPAVKGQAHYLLGSLLRESGQLDQAIHHLSEAIQLLTEDLKPYLELGSAYQERRQYDLALNTYHQAIAISPKDARAYYQSGLVLKEIRDYQAAEDMLRRAADLAPEDLTIHRQLGAIVALNLVHNRRPISLNISS